MFMKISLWRAAMPVTVVISNIAGLLIIGIASKSLSGSEFARFSLIFSNSILVSVILFEWLRLATFRLSTKFSGVGSEERRNAIVWMYALLSCLCLCASLVFIYFDRKDVSMLLLLSAIMSVFDGLQSYSRGEIEDKVFVSAAILRVILSVLLVWLSVGCGNGGGVIAGIALSYFLSVVFVYGQRIVMVRLNICHSFKTYKNIVLYGLSLSVCGALSLSIPVIVRNVAVFDVGGLFSGGFLLSTDMAQRLATGVGMSVSLLALPLSIKYLSESDGRSYNKVIQLNIVAVVSILAPTMIGFSVIARDILEIMSSSDIRVGSNTEIAFLSVGFALLSFRSFGIDSIFIMSGNSARAVVGPASGLIVASVVSFIIFWSEFKQPNAYGVGIICGSLVSLVVSIYMSRLVCDWRFPVVEVSCILLCGMVMGAVLSLMRYSGVLNNISLIVFVGGAIYVLSLFSLYRSGVFDRILNVAGTR